MYRVRRSTWIAGGLISVLLATSVSPATAFARLGEGESELVRSSTTSSERARQLAVDESTAVAQTRAVSSGEAVVIDELTTSVERTLALPDGTLQYESSTVPVRVQKDGAWISIDTKLVRVGDWLEPIASATPVRFSPGGTGALSEVQTPSGEWVTETWPHGALPEPMVSGATATYVEVLPGVDLKLTATDLGMASVYVVKSEKAAQSEVLRDLHVVLEGATVKRTSVGTFSANAGGKESIVASSPLWWDSSNGGTFVRPGGDDPMMPVVHSLNADGVSMDVAATLKEQSRTGKGIKYPIFVDPDWSAGPNAAWYTDAAFPNQSYLSVGQSDILRVGRYNPYRGNMFFEFGMGALAGKQILSAQLSTTQLGWAACPNNPLQVRTFGPQSAGFTWNQQNHSLWGPVLDTKNPGYCGSGAEIVGWDVTGGVSSRVGHANIQFGFAPQDENVQSRRHFSRAATLYVSYNSPPDTPTDPKFVTPATSCGTVSSPRYISASSVTVSVRQTDPDPGNVDVNFHLFKASDLGTSIQRQTTGLTAQGVKTVTFTGLVDGEAYAWRARGSDWMIDGVGHSPLCYFTIDRTGPSVPVITSSGGAATVGQPVTVTLTNPVADRVAFIAYMVRPAGQTAAVFDIFTTTPACGSASGLVRIACPNAAGETTITLAPTDSNSTLVAIPYDAAGNPGVIPGTPAGQAGKVGAQFPITAASSSAVAFAAGHVWLTQNQTLPLANAVDDSNILAPVALTLGSDTRRDQAANPIAPNVPIPRGVLGFEVLKELFSNYLSSVPTGIGSIGIYECTRTTLPHMAWGTESFCLSRYPDAQTELVGYSWAAGSRSDLVPLTQCEVDDPWMWGYAQEVCVDGDPVVQSLGFASTTPPPAGPDSTRSASGVVTPTSSFTVAAWLKPGASGAVDAISTDTTTAGFTLGATASNWQFCLRGSAPSPAVCATTPRQPDVDWTHVSGEWDSVNGQARLYLDGSVSAIVPFAWPAGTSSVHTAIYVGSSMASGTPGARWSGLIADPSIFQGIATSAQLTSLRAGLDPADG